jgi:C-terminal processing protease CtpA/Prc
LLKAAKPIQRQPIMRYRTMALWQDSLHADMAILHMSAFPNGRFSRFYRRAFRWIAEHGIRHLVVDLRNNTGGNIFNMDDLVARIADQPFSYQYEQRDGIHMAQYFKFRAKLNYWMASLKYRYSLRLKHRHSGDAHVAIRTVQTHRKHNFDGKVWVLTNGVSFSSASMCASFLKNKAGATVVGIETGGGEVGNCGGSYPKLELPHSRFKVRFPLYHLRYDVGKPDIGRGVMPDIPVTYQVKDLLESKDKDMEAVYEAVNKH